MLALLAECESVALDTEFVWERTYYPVLGLVQIACDRNRCFLIDVRASGDLRPLGGLLADGAVIKILHDAQQDLSILRHATGAWPRRVFDIRVAAGFAGLPATLSLADLVRELLGVELDKAETRSNWLQRPLSAEQIAYAVDDVTCLHRAQEALLGRVRELGHERWLSEELGALDNPELYMDRDPMAEFRRVKGRLRLPAEGLGILRELAAWRDEQARELDWTRTRVLPDRTLVNIASAQPRTPQDLARVNGLYASRVRQFGERILARVAQGLAAPVAPSGPSGAALRVSRRELKAQEDRVLEAVRAKCATLGIDPLLVTTRSDVSRLVRAAGRVDGAQHPIQQGWRWELAEDVVMPLFQSWPDGDEGTIVG